MKTPKKNRDELRRDLIVIPVTKDEKQVVVDAAEKMGLSMASFGRFVIRDYFKNHSD